MHEHVIVKTEQALQTIAKPVRFSNKLLIIFNDLLYNIKWLDL